MSAGGRQPAGTGFRVDRVRPALAVSAAMDVRGAWAVVFVACSLGPVGCGDDSGPVPSEAGVGCLDPLPDDCEPAFAPTFAAIYRNQISQKCGGSVCHGGDGAQAGLVLEGQDAAYDHLLGEADGRARVIPGDPECSVLMQRLESDDPAFQMPQGDPLSERELCAIRTWIRNGAMRSEDE